MASSLVRGGRHLLNTNSPVVFAAHKHPNDTHVAASLLPWMQTRPNTELAISKMTHGRGGKQSFTGNVVTVFGASGYMGRYVVNRLAKEGNQVIIPYRGELYDVFRLKVAGDLGQILFLPYEITDEDSIRKCVKYSNMAVNLVGRDWETKNFTFHQVHVDGARAIAKACREAGVEKFLHFSALGASPDPPRCLPRVPNFFQKSGASFLPNGSQYLKSKFHGELAVKEEFPEAVIFRPSDIIGQEDRFLRYYNSNWRRSIFNAMPMFEKGETSIKAPVFYSDVIDAVMIALKNKQISGQTYQCVGPHFYKLGDLIDYFLEITRRHLTHRRVDLFWNLRSWPTLMYCNYMELLFLNRPQYTYEKFEREAIPDVLLDHYPTMEDILPKGYKLTPIEKVAPYHLKYFRKGLYHNFNHEIPDPEPPIPLSYNEAYP